MSVSQVDQTIVVSAGAPILESERVEDSTYLNTRSVQDLPNNGRNFLSLVPLTPGVSIVQGPDGAEISINGQKGINNNISIDGADNNNPSSANSVAVNGRHLRSAWMPSKRYRWWPIARPPSLAAVRAASST